MNEFETTIHIMRLNHITYDELAKRTGQSGGNVYNALNKSKNIYVSSLLKMLDCMGYDIVVRQKGKTDGGYIIDNSYTPSPLRVPDIDMQFGENIVGYKQHEETKG